MKNLILAMVILLQSCATIVSGSKQTLKVSKWPGAAVEITDRAGNVILKDKSPCRVRLLRAYDVGIKAAYTVKLRTETQERAEYAIKTGYNGWILGNIVFTPLFMVLGAGVDYGTGAIYKLNTKRIK